MAKEQKPSSPTRRGLVLLGLILVFACAIHLPDLDHPYLPGWDEAIHAAVSANLSEHPERPTLFDRPFVPIDPRNWQGNHIWLHMPPLPFWQAALGLRLGGRSFFWLRFAAFALLLGTVVLIYLLGLRAYSEEAGLLAGLLYASAPFVWLQVQGYHFGDMTDVSLAFWLCACAYALQRALATGRSRWHIAAGLTQGAALLTKSALALAPAGACLLLWLTPKLGLRLSARPRWTLPALHLGLALGLWWAWRLFTWFRWPREHAIESEALWLHVTSSYEGHGRSWDALLNDLVANLFTPAFVLLAVAGTVWVAWRAWKEHSSSRAVHALWILGTWLPLFLVQTKVPAVLFGIAPALALAVAVLVLHLSAPRPGAWAFAFALAPAASLLLWNHLPTDLFRFAQPLAPDMAAAPHLPWQLGLALGLGAVFSAVAIALGRLGAERDWTRRLHRPGQLLLVAALVVPFGSALSDLRLTRQGFDIIGGYNPIASAAAALQSELTQEAVAIIEGVTDGRQRPELSLSFLTGRPAHQVPGHALGQAFDRARRIGTVILLTHIQREAQHLLSPRPGNGYWAYQIDERLPAPAVTAESTGLARYPTGPTLLRIQPAARRVAAGSALPVLAVWRARGPAHAHGTQIVLEPVAGTAVLEPHPREQDLPRGIQAVHLHNLSPPGLLWGVRPFGTALGEPHRWRPGFLVADDFFIWVPRHAPAGRYRLVQRMFHRGRIERPGEAVDWPVIEVVGR